MIYNCTFSIKSNKLILKTYFFLKNFLEHLVLLLAFSLTGFSQEYPVKFLDISDGLSNNSVTTIYQDSDGYMWFGTYDGLNRYDGYNFKVYRNRINDKKSLLFNTIYNIEGDSKKISGLEDLTEYVFIIKRMQHFILLNMCSQTISQKY